MKKKPQTRVSSLRVHRELTNSDWTVGVLLMGLQGQLKPGYIVPGIHLITDTGKRADQCETHRPMKGFTLVVGHRNARICIVVPLPS